MNAATISRFHSVMSSASRQRSASRRSMSSSSNSMRDGRLGMEKSVETPSDGIARRVAGAASASVTTLSVIRLGPARVPSREPPEAAVRLLQERNYTACEIDCEGGFWMGYPFAERFGELARDADIRLSLHAPIAGFLGHRERDKKYRMAVGML